MVAVTERAAAAANSDMTALRAENDALRARLDTYEEAIREASAVCAAAAHGDLERRVLRIRADGDARAMLRNLNHLLDMTDAFVRESGAALEHAAAEKFWRRVVTRGMRGTFHEAAELLNGATARAATAAAARATRVTESHAFEQAVKAMVEQLVASSSGAAQTAEKLRAAADRTSGETTVATKAADTMSASIGTVAAASEEVTASAREIEAQAEASQAAANRALAAAAETSSVMQGLADASQGITRVVALINEVAAQTRLLALNATIEAAHAGEAGKGFAVVASEVKVLATRTAGATGEIADRVESIIDASKGALRATASIEAAVTRMHEVSAAVRQAVGEQRMASQEISRSMQQASAGTRDVAEAISAAAAGTAETRQAADGMVGSANALAKVADDLMARIDRFLGTVRAT